MSATHNDDGRTASNQLDYHAIAARLGVDAEELRLFVRDHPSPTPSAVLGYAEADPEHREAVGRWLDTRQTGTKIKGDYSAIKDNLSRRQNDRGEE